MEVGGAERIVVQIVKGLVERGNQVGLMGSRGSLDADLADVPHDRFILPSPSRSAVGVARVLVAMRSVVTTFKPDVIHAQNVLHAALAGAAGRVASRPRPPVLATFHGLNPGELRIASKLFRAADAVACVSEDLRNVLVAAGFPASRAHLIRNAVDAAVPLTRERSAALDAELKLGAVAGGQRPPVVAIVGRLAPEKDHDRFLRAAARVAAQLPATRFLVVGDGKLRADLQALARELGIADKVVFTLARNDARELIAKSDLLVFSSKWEGLSIAALEALACGTPVVSTDAPGMSSLLDTGAGEIVRGGPEELGRAIVALLRDEDRRAAMGHIGRRLVAEEFSLPAMLDSYVRLYDGLVCRRVRRDGPLAISAQRGSDIAARSERDSQGKVTQ
jgi:glycosyltransferase involved in cell wall biosynthesis